MNWIDEVINYKEELIEIRRYLHMNPELSFQEKILLNLSKII